MIQLHSTQGIAAANGVKMLVYGKAGTGKTVLCATCPNPVVFSAEAGLLSLSQFNIPFAQVTNINALRDCYNWARSSNEAKQFQTLCLDSLSEIAEVVLATAKAGVKDPRQAYGALIEQMNEIIRGFRDLPRFHVYMSAKQEMNKNEQTGATSFGPSMPGSKLGQGLPYFFDEVFQLGIEGVGAQSYRYLRTQPDFMNDAKDRSGRLNAIEEPHLGKVIQKITGT